MSEELEIFVHQLTPHPRHSFNDQFVAFDKSRVPERYSKSNIWHNYILMESLPNNEVSNLAVEIIETSRTHIGLGIGSSAIFEKVDTKKSSQNVFYDLSARNININRAVLKTHFKFYKGSCVRLEVNLSSKTIIFFTKNSAESEEKFIATVDIPHHLSKKDLFFFISLQDCGDQVRLLQP